jgi:Cu(I)/Ag(I) efflux system membrane fusion protein/cobalt-zinc-cadmium efflux system membrane fusion protein
MRTTIIAILALVVGFALAYIVLPDSSGEATAAAGDTAQQYTCGMHPEIVSDEPGYCPICGMKLTPKKEGAAAAGSIVIDPTTTQNMGLVTEPASYRTLERQVRAFGEIEFAEPNVHSVNLKVDGWVERLFVDSEGEQVRAGQPLLEIYSPELVAAQREYLIAVRNRDNGADPNAKLLSAARKRLANWDISAKQIEALEATDEVKRTMIIHSPAAGVVVAKPVEEGDRVGPGTQTYQVVDLSEVWVTAYIYEQDLPFVEVGALASIELPSLPDRVYRGHVTYVSPYLDNKRQVEVRLVVDNSDAALKPEMYAEVAIRSELPGERLAIQRSAVINSGERELVFVSKGDGSYDPRRIETGAVADNDLVEVVEGLKAGDKVVTSGQFLLDSESRLAEALHAGTHQHTQSSEDSAAHQHQEHKQMQAKETESGIIDTNRVYTCPMPEHFHVVQYGPGGCAECGMKLVPVEETDNQDIFVCPMRVCDVAQADSGRCGVCGMNLVRYQIPAVADVDSSSLSEHPNMHEHAEMAHEQRTDTMVVYTCPMPEHFDVVQYGTGRCPECGMKLVPATQTDNEEVFICPMRECGVVQPDSGRCAVCGMNLIKYEPEVGHDH